MNTNIDTILLDGIYELFCGENVNRLIKGGLLRSGLFRGAGRSSAPGSMYKLTETNPLAFAHRYVSAHTELSYDESRRIHDHIQIIKGREQNKHGVFSLLCDVTDPALYKSGDDLLCKYEELPAWRRATHKFGQSIFIAARYARDDVNTRTKRRHDNFVHPPFLRCDNQALHSILERGMAENHFHLKGSAPVFLTSWICLMNRPAGREKEFRNNAFKHLFGRWPSDDLSFPDMITTAAAIRFLLNAVLDGVGNKAQYWVGLPEQSNRSNAALVLNRKIISYHADKPRFRRLDYAGAFYDDCDVAKRPYLPISGENRFLYRAFYAIFSEKDDFIKNYADLFYAYLIMSVRVRGELVQCNHSVGFHNFAMFEQRKDVFLDQKKRYARYNKALLTTAIASESNYRYIRSMEIRVVPKLKTGAQSKMLADYMNRYKHYGFKRHKCYFVAHFIKFEDKQKRKNFYLRPRHYENLKKHKKQLEAILGSLNRSLKYHTEIPPLYGLDAANNELQCPPEIMAPLFREARVRSPRLLRFTFHAGEDFYDIGSGLRAIEETRLFLEYKRDDRLGHAVALGIDPDTFYKFKGMSVLTTRQELLDTVVFIIKYTEKYDCCRSALRTQLERIFYTNIGMYKLTYPLQDMPLSIEDYYNFWLLRGDDPFDYYPSIRTNVGETPGTGAHAYAVSHDLYRQRFAFKERYSPWALRDDALAKSVREENHRAVMLMSMYHYDKDVKIKGAEPIDFHITPEYAEAVRLLQTHFQREIAAAGIGIESNPSSNVLISVFKDYSKHPMMNLYNKGLVTEENENALISVSINTDDAGVFDTDLENEYMLMAAAAENTLGADNRPLYKPERVKEWLDNIRMNGLNQSFLPQKRIMRTYEK